MDFVQPARVTKYLLSSRHNWHCGVKKSSPLQLSRRTFNGNENWVHPQLRYINWLGMRVTRTMHNGDRQFICLHTEDLFICKYVVGQVCLYARTQCIYSFHEDIVVNFTLKNILVIA